MLRCLATLSCAISIVCVATSCQRIAAPSGLLEQTIPHAHLTSQKLRTLVTDYVPRYALQVEEAADRILAESTDPKIRRQALLWKSQGIAACFRAAARPDALAALVDIWILARQSTEFFERTANDPPLGPWQNLAIDTSRRLEEPLRQIHATLGEDLKYGEPFILDFCAKHPLHSLYFDRPSIASEYIESITVPNPELMSVVGGLNENVADMRKLSALYADFLPKQSRWQAELLLIDTVAQQPVEAVVADLAIATRAADRIATTAESLPALVERERQAGQALLSAERQAAFADLEQMRTATITAIQQERAAVLAAFREERELTGAALEAVANRVLANTNQVVESRTSQLADSGNQFFDKFYRRTLQWTLIVAVVVLSIAVLRWLPPLKRSQPANFGPPVTSPTELQRPERKPPRAAA